MRNWRIFTDVFFVRRIFLSAVAVVVAFYFVFNVPREDVLVCKLQSNEIYVLKSKYDWSPLANFIPADVADRLNQKPWSIWMKRKQDWLLKPLNAGIFLDRYDRECLQLGIKDGVPLVRDGFFLNDKWFFIKKGQIEAQSFHEHQPALSREMEKMNLVQMRDFGLTFPGKGRLVYEIAFGKVVRKNYIPVMAVVQSVSLDNGKTWSNPIITKRSEIYKIGASELQQPFLAKPYSLNGERVIPQVY